MNEMITSSISFLIDIEACSLQRIQNNNKNITLATRKIHGISNVHERKKTQQILRDDTTSTGRTVGYIRLSIHIFLTAKMSATGSSVRVEQCRIAARLGAAFPSEKTVLCHIEISSGRVRSYHMTHTSTVDLSSTSLTIFEQRVVSTEKNPRCSAELNLTLKMTSPISNFLQKPSAWKLTSRIIASTIHCDTVSMPTTGRRSRRRRQQQ